MIDFKQLRFDKDFHLGLGDIRLTVGMQEEIDEHIAELEEQNIQLEFALKLLIDELNELKD